MNRVLQDREFLCLKEDGAMSDFPTGRRKRRKISRLIGRIAAIIAGVVLAALGAAACLLSGLSIFLFRNEPKFLFILPIFLFLAAVMFLLFLLGLKIIRDAVRAARDHTLDNIDLNREPWMANTEWRNRRIVHKITAVSAVRYLQITGMVVLLCFVAVGVMIVPADILVTALLIAGGIALALIFLYRHLRNSNVEVQPRQVLPVIFAIPVVIAMPGALNLFSPEINRVLETTAMTFMVGAAAGILVYLLLKEKKYGMSVCHLRTLPAFVGGVLEAEIEISFPQIKTGLPKLPEGPVEAELQNFTSSGRSVITHWRRKITIPVPELIRPGDGTLRIPVSVAIPIEESGQMKKWNFWTGGAWKLEVRAAFPGVDYASWFIVPVYFPEAVHGPISGEGDP